MKQLTILEVTPELLMERLNLKDGMTIVNMFQTDRNKLTGTFSITLSGAECPKVPEGGHIPITPYHLLTQE